MTVPVAQELKTKYVRIAFSKPITMSIENFNEWFRKFMSSRLFSLMMTDVDEFCKLTTASPKDWSFPTIMEFQITNQPLEGA